MTVHFIGRSQLYPTLTRILCRSEYSKFVSNRADAQQCAEPEELRRSRNHSQSSRPRRLQKFCAMSASDTVPSRLFVRFALETLQEGGCFICKFFDTFTHVSCSLLYVAAALFQQVDIVDTTLVCLALPHAVAAGVNGSNDTEPRYIPHT
eukprot:s6473_g4.t1